MTQTTYQQEQKAKSDKISTACTAIAIELGDAWTLAPHFHEGTSDWYGANFRRQDGLSFYAFQIWNKPRLEFKASIPARRGANGSSLSDWGVAPHGTTAPACTVAMDRDAKAATLQIRRTVIEPFEPLYVMILQRRAEDTESTASAIQRLTDLRVGLEPLGELRVDDHSEGYGRSSFTLRVNGIDHHRHYIEGTIGTGGDVELKLRNLPAALAIQIAALIAAS